MQPLELALAIDDARAESALLSLLQETGFRVDGRECRVMSLCASVRDLETAVASGALDGVVVASTLNAIPFATLRSIARDSRGMVVLAPDPLDECWDGFPAPVIASNPDATSLAEALHRAIHGGTVTGAVRRRQTHEPAPPPSRAESTVIVLTSAYAAEGRTTIATSLAFALGTVADTVLIDGDVRGGTVEFALGVDPGRNLCLLAQQEPETPAAWEAGLRSELQPMGHPSRRGAVLAGVTKPSLRPWVTPVFFEHLIEALRRRYAYIVLDTSGGGWSPDDGALDRLCLRLADRLLMIVRPDAQGVAVARRVLRQWTTPERVSVILNQTGLAGQYPRAEVEAALGVPLVSIVPADPRGVAAARARHRPAVCQPGCRIAAPLLNLAGRLYRGEALELAPDVLTRGTQPWWRRRLTFGAVANLQ